MVIPQLVEAFFSVGGKSDSDARAAHRMFMDRYPMQSVPVVRYDSSDDEQPFRELAD